MEKQKQRLISLILALVMCVAMLPVVTNTVEADIVIYHYDVSEILVESYCGTCGDNLSWTFEDGVLTISGTGNMYDYQNKWGLLYDGDILIDEIGYVTVPWFYHVYYSNIESVVIEEGVTSIGSWAFGLYGYDGSRSTISSVSLPDTLTEIGDYAFANLWGLTSITIPCNVVSIGYAAFSTCVGLREIIFEGDAPSFDEYAFEEVLATAYYPAENSTWTEDIMQRYVGYAGNEYSDITWAAYTPEEEISFTDVSADQYFYDAVQWAVENGVTTGTDTGVFSPFVECERCQIVTFLWRAAGSPTVEGVENPFTDVNEDDYFYMAVLWAVKEGITTGTDETTFSPYAKCERCQVITFIWRYAGKPSAKSTTTKFTDVASDAYYATAVAWALENGITTGTTSTKFGSIDTCERCMVVTFLYRYMG